VLFGQHGYAFLRPFDDANTFAAQIFVKPQVDYFLDAVEPIEIYMV
jgi:hypothetical protein